MTAPQQRDEEQEIAALAANRRYDQAINRANMLGAEVTELKALLKDEVEQREKVLSLLSLPRRLLFLLIETSFSFHLSTVDREAKC